jgi:beta-galactosidase/beta-glucuronidase
MRKISTGDVDGAPRILLNNKPYYQVGLLEHGRWPDSIFTQPSDECLQWEIQTAKDMGFNTIRSHLKVESERWYSWCDKMGMLIWQDMPVPTFFSAYRPKSEEDKQILRDTLRDMMVQRYNHPSIISWIIFNEGGAQFEPRKMTLLAKKLDASRLINTTSHIWLTDEAKREPGDSQSRFNTDYYDAHCYERTLKFYYEGNTSYIPAAFGEFGGIGLKIDGHTWNPTKKPWG